MCLGTRGRGKGETCKSYCTTRRPFSSVPVTSFMTKPFAFGKRLFVGDWTPPLLTATRVECCMGSNRWTPPPRCHCGADDSAHRPPGSHRTPKDRRSRTPPLGSSCRSLALGVTSRVGVSERSPFRPFNPSVMSSCYLAPSQVRRP